MTSRCKAAATEAYSLSLTGDTRRSAEPAGAASLELSLRVPCCLHLVDDCHRKARGDSG
jgi:hypothetical protein